MRLGLIRNRMTDFDVVIVGAGIAGASLAAELAPAMRVLVIEAESHPGFHATGRSAAFWTESYGGPDVQPLTTASGPFLANPPPDFADRPLKTPRGALYIGTADDTAAAGHMLSAFSSTGVRIEPVDKAEIERRLPGVRSQWSHGLWEPDCCDIDVAALHAAYQAQFRRRGGQIICNARLKAAKYGQGRWTIETTAGLYTAARFVNAAGAWADDIAQIAGIQPVGIQAFRRTIAQIITNPPAPGTMPLVLGLDGSFYFKSDIGGRIWLSPHDETLSAACDAAPEEIDIALAIERFTNVLDWQVQRVEHKWAGLRSFAPDRLPVIGYDAANPAFFWLSGQGGFGIQTAPVVSRLAAALLKREPTVDSGINPALYDPQRFI